MSHSIVTVIMQDVALLQFQCLFPVDFSLSGCQEKTQFFEVKVNFNIELEL